MATLTALILLALLLTFILPTTPYPRHGCRGTGRPDPSIPPYYTNLYLNQTLTEIPEKYLQKMRVLVDEVSEMIAKDFPADMPSWQNTPYVYWGTAGRAAFALRMIRDAEMSKDGRDPAVWLKRAQINIDSALNETQAYKYNPASFAFQKGRTGILAVAAVIYERLGEKERVEEFIEELTWIFDQATSNAYFDWENGYAGLVYAGNYLNNYFAREIVSEERIDRILRLMYAQGMSKYNATTGAMQYEYFQGHYWTGMGSHGSGSPTYALLNSERLMRNETIRQHVKSTVDYYLSLQQPSGQIPGDFSDGDRVQWCHGMPGLLAPIGAAYRVYGEEKYLHAGLLGADLTTKFGLISKGMQFCHGVGGNIYMMLDFYTQTRDERVLSMAISMILTSLDIPQLSDPTQWYSFDCVPEGMFVSSAMGMVLLYSDILVNAHDLSKMQMLSFHMSV